MVVEEFYRWEVNGSHASGVILASEVRIFARVGKSNLRSGASLERGKIRGDSTLLCKTAAQASPTQFYFDEDAKGKFSFSEDFINPILEELLFFILHTLTSTQSKDALTSIR